MPGGALRDWLYGAPRYTSGGAKGKYGGKPKY
jgi:hypothetical protein